MKKTRMIITAVAAMMLVLTGCAAQKTAEAPKESVKIGITQIVSHPSLDMIRQGIVDGLREAGYEEGKNLEIDFKNAEGAMDNAALIAQGFEAGKKDLVIGITTPCAQSIYQTVKSAPILFSAVTDPVGAGLESQRITGVSDKTPIGKQFDLLKKLFPDAKVIGMVYNSSEQNSVVQVEEAKAEAANRGMELKTAAISNTNEMAQAIDEVLSSSDVFYAQVDNTIASAFPLIMEKTKAKEVPIIGSVAQYVNDGAVATDGIDNYQIGKQTAQIAVRVLKGESVSSIPFETLKETELVFNKSSMAKFGLVIPDEYKDKAKIVE